MSTPFQDVITPICVFLCGSGEDGARCRIGCELFKNCALTPNILYTAVYEIINNSNVFTAGLESLIAEQASSIAIRLAAYQQLPWFISFLLLVIVLSFAGAIGIFALIVLILFSVGLLFLFAYLTYQEIINNITQLLTTILGHITNNISGINENANPNIIDAISAAFLQSQVPCGCKCSGV